MRFGVLTQYYPPEIGAPQARLSELADRFARRGHEVHVLTAIPNYPMGKRYPGYPLFFRTERHAKIRVVRTFVYPTQKLGLLPRLTSYLSFATSSLIVGLGAIPRLDYLLTESPPLFLGLSGFALSRVKSARWIFNVSDLWPDSAVNIGVLREGKALSLAYSLEAFCYRHAWLVTGQSPGIVASINRRFPSVRTYHLSNGVDTTRFRPSASAPDRAGLGAPGECIAIYAGLHGAAQGLRQVLDAAALLRQHPTLRIAFVGDGPEKADLVKYARDLRLDNVRFFGVVPGDAMPRLLASADIAIASMKGDIPGMIPSKIYEGMASGRPVLLIGQGEPAELVAQTGAGLSVLPNDPESIVAALAHLADSPELRAEMGARGREAATARFSRDAIADALIDMLEDEAPCRSANAGG